MMLVRVIWLLPSRHIGAVVAALSRSPAVVDHPVGQEGIIARRLSHPDITLGGPWSVIAQDAVDLTPASGPNPDAGHGVDPPAGRKRSEERRTRPALRRSAGRGGATKAGVRQGVLVNYGK